MATEKTFQLGPVKVRVTTPDTSAEPADRRERSERLTRDRIVDVALAQMAERGYDAVSMRSIAKQLGTGPASLYAHVASKDGLDQLVLDRIAAQMEIPEPDPDRWQEQVRQLFAGMLDLYRAHPGSARAAVATIPAMEGGLRVADAAMALLLAGGIHPQAAAWFVDLGALFVSAVGAEESIWDDRRKAASAAGVRVEREEVVEEIHRIYRSLPPSAYPALAAHATEMTAGDGQRRFEFGLDVLLAGLQVVSDRMKAADTAS